MADMTASSRASLAPTGNAVHLSNFSCDAFFVAAAEGCVRLRSSRESGCRGVSDAAQHLILRLLRPNAGFASCYRSNYGLSEQHCVPTEGFGQN
ncbi:MAG: hypothetical protein ACN6Q5_13405, partial [Pseudomonas sp.]|uniref:hypothetical protein n=1 Tax=Pseudomonas sp. TaxID=306 RepID=UPI003D0A547C